MTPTSPPIFIGGLFKSGTTLLRAMVGNHSRIASGLETYWFEVRWDARKGQSDEPIEEYFKRLAKFYDLPEASVLEMGREAANIHDFLNQFLGTYAQESGKTRWAEKTPGNVCHMDRIFSGWPDARVLHIVRDPKDVLASLRESRKWDQPEVFAEKWCAFLPRVEEARKSGLLTEQNYLEIRYESLVNQPEAQTRQILEFLDEPWEPAVANFAGKDNDYEKVLDVTGRESSTLARLKQPLGQDRIGIWRHVLSQDDVEGMRSAIQAAGHGDLLSAIETQTLELGY
jgi:hypothetical protein